MNSFEALKCARYIQLPLIRCKKSAKSFIVSIHPHSHSHFSLVHHTALLHSTTSTSHTPPNYNLDSKPSIPRRVTRYSSQAKKYEAQYRHLRHYPHPPHPHRDHRLRNLPPTGANGGRRYGIQCFRCYRGVVRLEYSVREEERRGRWKN